MVLLQELVFDSLPEGAVWPFDRSYVRPPHFHGQLECLGSGSGGADGLLVPAQGALFGAFVGTGTIAQLETTLGRKLAISHNFFGWSDDYPTWVRTTLQSGYVPLVTWEAWTNGSAGIP